MGFNLDTNYNYVFFNTSGDYFEPEFKPLKKYSNVRIYDYAFCSNRILQKIFFLHWSNKLNRIIHLPFKSIWYNLICNQSFNDNKPICFVSLGGKYFNDDPNLIKHIKKINPNNKCVIYCSDLISKKNWDISKVKNHCDFIMTFDEGEAKQYDILHYPALGYGAIIDIVESKSFKNDVYFLGFAKDRLDDIHYTYKVLKNNGFRCKFIICGTSPEDRLVDDGLYYQKPISYRENLKNVNESKCVLELIQGGGTSLTLRTQEAQVYKRKLLTNNINLFNQTYYDEKNMSVFSNANNIDFDFLRSEIDYDTFYKNYLFEPEKIIEYLEEKLEDIYE